MDLGFFQEKHNLFEEVHLSLLLNKFAISLDIILLLQDKPIFLEWDEILLWDFVNLHNIYSLVDNHLIIVKMVKLDHNNTLY